jgi:hypothetical protein
MMWAGSTDVASAQVVTSEEDLLQTARGFAFNAVGGVRAVPESMIEDVRALRAPWSDLDSARTFLSTPEEKI